MQGESRSQVYLDYAEPPPIFVQVSAIELDLIAERSRKCQEKVHLYEYASPVANSVSRYSSRRIHFVALLVTGLNPSIF